MKFEGNPDAPFSYLAEVASTEIDRVINDLPDALRDTLSKIAVVLEEFPTPENEAQGVDPEQLGLFEGASADDNAMPHTPKIVLWLGNLWEMSGASEKIYREEVGITMLHELGHYLGFNEEDLIDRGLE